MPTINTIFFDIGGVILSNAWDREQRQRAAEQWGFDYAAFDARHLQVIDSLEGRPVVPSWLPVLDSLV